MDSARLDVRQVFQYKNSLVSYVPEIGIFPD